MHAETSSITGQSPRIRVGAKDLSQQELATAVAERIVMQVGKFRLSVVEDPPGSLTFHVRVNTRHPQEFADSLEKLYRLASRTQHTRKILLYFGEFLDIPDHDQVRFASLGIAIEKIRKPQTLIENRQIWLMRHGYYDLGTGELTPEGITRVKNAATIFPDRPLTLYHSPVRRCVQTAAILKAQRTGAELHQIPWLNSNMGLPEDWLLQLPGETVVIVSHHTVLGAIAEQLMDHHDFFNFVCGWPVAVISTPQGNRLQPCAGNL
jgi:phosphohistidine phosphatase SixA